METKDYTPTNLNEPQLMMLRLFKQRMPDEEYEEVRRLIVKLLAKNIDDEMGKLEKEKGWTQDTYEQWGKEHLSISP